MSLSISVAEANLRSRVDVLRKQLQEAEDALNENAESSENGITHHTNGVEDFGRTSSPPPPSSHSSHKGYLFKWQDRSIGWGGSKWSLRFVSLSRGKLSYYRTHHDAEPRYVLALRGFAVRDDGHKRNNRHKPKGGRNVVPPVDEKGAYFHLFSIYQRGDEGRSTDSDIVPLLRFSTPSFAEKNQWVSIVSEACQYADTDDFLLQEEKAALEEEKRKEERKAMAIAMPQAQRGTLPPLYFAPLQQPVKLKRTVSGTKIPRRLYRTTSKEMDAEKIESRSTRGYPPSKPMHRKNGVSHLSAEAPVQNYRGLFNLAVIVLVITNLRLLIESTKKHGAFWKYLPNFGDFLASKDKWHDFPLLYGFALMQAFIVSGYWIESILSRNMVGNRLGMLLHHLNAHSCLGIMIFVVWNYVDVTGFGAIILFYGVITWMKLLSYSHANEDYRMSPNDAYQNMIGLVKDVEPHDKIEYPENVSLANLYYFWFAPTLTYQIAFPRSPRIRIWMVVGYAVRILVVVVAMGYLSAQIVTPNLKKLVNDLEESNGAYTWDILAEYGFKLSIVNTYLWLLTFYGYFHCYLNLFGELLRFGDRQFYKDWWNSSDVSSYWRLWNMPVHYWLVRHIYFPCLRMGMSRIGATLVVFLLSAVMHEVIVSVPFHLVRPWSFIGMLMQVPLVIVTRAIIRKFPGTSLGNIIFWVSFCIVGQPTAVLLYTVDSQFYKHHDTVAQVTEVVETCRRNFWGKLVCRAEEL